MNRVQCEYRFRNIYLLKIACVFIQYIKIGFDSFAFHDLQTIVVYHAVLKK